MSSASLENQFDIKKYKGTWYQFAATPMWFYRRGSYNVMAKYEETSDSNTLSVLNTMTVKGKEETIEGTLTATSTPLHYKVRLNRAFFFFPVTADYVIKAIVTNPQGDYMYAVVGGKEGSKYCFVLSRNQQVSCADQLYLRELICKLGYSWNDLEFTAQICEEVKANNIMSTRNK